jgi:hypothetical protein
MRADFSNEGSIILHSESIEEYHAMRKLFPFGQHKKAHLECSMGSVMGPTGSKRHYTMHVHPISPHE